MKFEELDFFREGVPEWIAKSASIGFAQLQAGRVFEVGSEQKFIDLIRSPVPDYEFDSKPANQLNSSHENHHRSAAGSHT